MKSVFEFESSLFPIQNDRARVYYRRPFWYAEANLKPGYKLSRYVQRFNTLVDAMNWARKPHIEGLENVDWVL